MSDPPQLGLWERICPYKGGSTWASFQGLMGFQQVEMESPGLEMQLFSVEETGCAKVHRQGRTSTEWNHRS